MSTNKSQNRTRRHKRIRSKVKGTADRPRLSVFRSNKGMYVQLINDQAGITLVAKSDYGYKNGTKTEKAIKLAEEVVKLAKDKNITNVVFDRGGYLYAGRVKALAEAARSQGLIF